MRKREGQSDRRCVKNDHYFAVGQSDPTSKMFHPNTSFGFTVHTGASPFFQGKMHFQNPRKVNVELMRLQILSITVVMQRQLKTESSVSQSGIAPILISSGMFTQSFKIK